MALGVLHFALYGICGFIAMTLDLPGKVPRYVSFVVGAADIVSCGLWFVNTIRFGEQFAMKAEKLLVIFTYVMMTSPLLYDAISMIGYGLPYLYICIGVSLICFWFD